MYTNNILISWNLFRRKLKMIITCCCACCTSWYFFTIDYVIFMVSVMMMHVNDFTIWSNFFGCYNLILLSTTNKLNNIYVYYIRNKLCRHTRCFFGTLRCWKGYWCTWLSNWMTRYWYWSWFWYWYRWFAGLLCGCRIKKKQI